MRTQAQHVAAGQKILRGAATLVVDAVKNVVEADGQWVVLLVSNKGVPDALSYRRTEEVKVLS